MWGYPRDSKSLGSVWGLGTGSRAAANKNHGSLKSHWHWAWAEEAHEAGTHRPREREVDAKLLVNIFALVREVRLTTGGKVRGL